MGNREIIGFVGEALLMNLCVYFKGEIGLSIARKPERGNESGRVDRLGFDPQRFENIASCFIPLVNVELYSRYWRRT
jgi:hypothetical protein